MQKKPFVAICFGFSEKIASLTGLNMLLLEYRSKLVTSREKEPHDMSFL